MQDVIDLFFNLLNAILMPTEFIFRKTVTFDKLAYLLDKAFTF